MTFTTVPAAAKSLGGEIKLTPTVTHLPMNLGGRYGRG